ncbi:MAG: ATP-binding protein, partial [Acetobacteraceae bacterium]|nr:ATP-binding protein [Acetobacteraceae bacterium]
MSGTEASGFSLPKPPGLAEEDVRAIRGFRPGKLLGRTAVVLSLALLVLGSAAVVDQGLKGLLDATLPLAPWQRLGLLLGLPALVVIAQLCVEWRAERVRRRLQSLAVQSGAVPQGYFRIGPYLDTAEDRAGFDRADRAHERVLEWVKRSAGVPLYLTGDSGSGKSSLLNAFVLPSLRQEGWTVVEARVWQDPEAALRDALARLPGARRPRTGEDRGLRGLIEAAARRSGAGLLLVLDQFEEFLILGRPEQRQRFAALIDDLRSDPVNRLCLLLALRSDYQFLLEDLGLPPLRHGENFYQVGRFALGAAGRFMERSDLGLPPDALGRLLDSAAALDETPGLVRPITLNVVGHVLATGQGPAPSLDAGRLVRLYIERTVSQPTVRDYAAPVLERLVTEQGTKQPRPEQELVAETRLRRGEVRGVLNALSAAALARPLDAEQGVWELSHDFIARAVVRHLGRRRRDLARRGAFYAAPILLGLTLLGGAGVLAWDLWNPLR